MNAIQYKEISRRPGKFGDIVERNGHAFLSIFKTMVREVTIPNGTKEGKPVLMVRMNGKKYVINLTDWVVVDNDSIEVLTNEQYIRKFERVTVSRAHLE